MKTPNTFQACVIGGAGHVGAPLAIVLASRGIRTLIYDTNRVSVDLLRRGVMPFVEVGAEQLLERALADGMLGFASGPEEVAGCEFIVISVGTPIDEFHNPRLDAMTRAVKELMPYLNDAQLIILRSTVFPGTTENMQRYLQENGLLCGVACCPERVVQGRAIEEVQSLPQIVSGTTQVAEERAARLFSRVTSRVIRVTPKEAEFAKLITNAYRYLLFAVANQFFMTVTAAGVDYSHVLSAVRDGYPRAQGLPGPGFAAGPCLMKDTMQLGAFDNRNFLLGNMAKLVNEGLPDFIVEHLSKQRSLSTSTIGILGMAFKADIDDIRESLSYKLAKILRFKGANVLCSDAYVRDPSFVSAEELLSRCDVVIVGVPHTRYRDLRVPAGVEILDLWSILPEQVLEIAALRSG